MKFSKNLYFLKYVSTFKAKYKNTKKKNLKNVQYCG